MVGSISDDFQPISACHFVYCLLPQGLYTPHHVIKVTICISMLFHPQYKLQSGSGQGLNRDTTIYIESCQTDIVLTRMTEFTI